MSVIPFHRRDDVDDVEESLNRYGSLDPANHCAHRVVNPSVLSALTGFPLDVCEEFHHVLFALLEAVGDFDGLIATPSVCIGRADALFTAGQWIASNPSIDVEAAIAAGDEMERNHDLWQRIADEITAHSLTLAMAIGTNPSLTFGSIEAVSERLADDVLDITLSCIPKQIDELTTVALDLIARLPESVLIIGNTGRSTCLTRDTFRGWQA
jgi:hypothetical protein